MAGQRMHSGRNGTDYDHDGDTVLGGSGDKVGFYGSVGVVKGSAFTALDASTVDGTYGSQEAAVINSLRVTLQQVMDAIEALNLVAS